MRGLVVLVIVIVAIVTAFTAALFWKAHNIGKIEKMLNETNKELAEHEDIIKNKLKEDIQETMNNIIQMEKENIKADIMRTMREDLQQLRDGIVTDIADCRFFSKYPSSKCKINWSGWGFTENSRPDQRVHDSEPNEDDDDDDDHDHIEQDGNIDVDDEEGRTVRWATAKTSGKTIKIKGFPGRI